MSKVRFVTGTDTGVGKTVVSCALLQAAIAAGYCALGYKPVASGSEITAEGMRNSDALALQRNSQLSLPYEQINAYTFLEPTSPHIVSAKHHRPIDFSVLSAGLNSLRAQSNWVLVEGAGGWFTPLSHTSTFAEWVVAEQLPTILVVGVKLGCINHALLTARAVLAGGVPLAGWVANNVELQGQWHKEYMMTLTEWIPAPLLGEIPWFSSLSDNSVLGQYIDLSLLVY